MVKAWVFEFNSIQGRDIPDFQDRGLLQDTFDTNLARVSQLEEIGFEGVFFSEHHFLASLSPAPHLLIASAAARTKRLKLGVMGTVLAFHEPWRVTEELAMLDYMTNGRLEIGVAAGVPPEFLYAGIAQDDVRPRYLESLEFLEKALESDVVTHEGRFWNFDEIPISPVPKQVDRRRKWMTVYSANSCRFAAQRGYKVCTGLQSVENATLAFDAYREEAEKVGYDITPDDLGIRRNILVASTDAEAEELFERTLPREEARMTATFAPVTERLMRELGHGPDEAVIKSGTMDAAAPKHADTPAPTVAPIGPGLDDEYLHGSPETVAEKIIDQCRRMGAGNVLAITMMSLTKDEFNRHYGLWDQVIPILQKADISH